MAEEHYVEGILIRSDNVEVDTPSFTDEQCDMEFEFEGIIKLKQILKSVQNTTHNKHDYVFELVEITKMQEII